MTLFDLNEHDSQNTNELIADSKRTDLPLAARMRPANFTEFAGQEHLVGEDRVLRKCIESDNLPSLVF